MLKSLILVPLLIASSPVVAQPAPQLPPELTDPATMQRLAGTAQALSNALLNVKVGGIEAAIEGREASPQERNVTVGDLARRKDPDFDRHIQQQIATVGPQLQRSMRALNEALPQMVQSLKEAQKALERAVANLPDPTYPRR